jgi:hypothetical protein
MALPVVSYGTYNYGDYASPKAVQYKGGLGEGLTTAILGIQKAKQEQKAQIKQALEDSLLLSSEFSSKLNTLFGKASSYNKQFLQNLKVDYGNNVKNYKLGKISFEEFEENNSYFDNILNDATLLSQIMQPVVTSESDIKFTDARDDDDNQASVLTRWGIKNGKYLLDRDENGLKVVVAHGTPGSFEAKGISATELINNPAYITPELKYRNEENEAYNKAAASLKELLLLKPDLITATNYSKTGQTLFNIDPAKQAQIMAEIANQDGIDSILGTDLQKRTYFEDNMKDKNGNPNGVGSYKGTDEQIAAIKGALSVDLYNTLSKNPIGSKAYTPPSPDSKGEKDRINQLRIAKQIDNIQKLDFSKSMKGGPREEGKPLVNMAELENTLSVSPYYYNVNKGFNTGGTASRDALVVTKTIEGADRQVTIMDNFDEYEIKSALIYLETGENVDPKDLRPKDDYKGFQF